MLFISSSFIYMYAILVAGSGRELHFDYNVFSLVFCYFFSLLSYPGRSLANKQLSPKIKKKQINKISYMPRDMKQNCKFHNSPNYL